MEITDDNYFLIDNGSKYQSLCFANTDLNTLCRVKTFWSCNPEIKLK